MKNENKTKYEVNGKPYIVGDILLANNIKISFVEQIELILTKGIQKIIVYRAVLVVML